MQSYYAIYGRILGVRAVAWLEEIMGQIQQSSSKKPPPSQTCMYMHMYMYVEYLSMCVYVQYAIIIIADTKQRCYV